MLRVVAAFLGSREGGEPTGASLPTDIAGADRAAFHRGDLGFAQVVGASLRHGQ
jgi:hypothetical protein